MSLPSINLVVALPAEARPLASRFALERVQPDLGFPLYRRGRVSLTISGTGKVNAAAATSLLGALGGRKLQAIWVNVGIAGHAERPVGAVLLANRITDAGSGQSWHPMLMRDQPCPTGSVLTLDQPDMEYARGGMVDMEASGFFPTACRYSGRELVQVLKVISDNCESSVNSVSAKQVHRLIEGGLDTLDRVLAHLTECVEARSDAHSKRQVG